MRLFIALELEPIKTYIDGLREGLRQKGISLTKDEHLTLQFLGEVDEKTAEKVEKALAEAQFSSFTITTAGMGFFPDENHPRVVWLGVEKNEVLLQLQKDVEKALGPFGFKKDFSFHPHITLGRVKFLDDTASFLQKVKRLKIEQHSATIDHFALIESKLTPDGPEYTVLASFT